MDEASKAILTYSTTSLVYILSETLNSLPRVIAQIILCIVSTVPVNKVTHVELCIVLFLWCLI